MELRAPVQVLLPELSGDPRLVSQRFSVTTEPLSPFWEAPGPLALLSGQLKQRENSRILLGVVNKN